jgi:hypothetical protein
MRWHQLDGAVPAGARTLQELAVAKARQHRTHVGIAEHGEVGW